MKRRPFPCAWLAALALAAAVPLSAAFIAGGTAYPKRYETALLAEPTPLAKSSAKAGPAAVFKVLDVRGPWVQVSDGTHSGWVFSGNLRETKPADTNALAGSPLLASKTTTTAAARPLAPAAEDYAQRRNLTSARDDLNWLRDQARLLTENEVAAFLQEQKKGEFQP